MSTWHQMKRPVQLWHETQWTVVDDPPNECMSLWRYESEQEARDYVARRVARGTGGHCFVVAPRKRA